MNKSLTLLSVISEKEWPIYKNLKDRQKIETCRLDFEEVCIYKEFFLRFLTTQINNIDKNSDLFIHWNRIIKEIQSESILENPLKELEKYYTIEVDKKRLFDSKMRKRYSDPTGLVLAALSMQESIAIIKKPEEKEKEPVSKTPSEPKVQSQTSSDTNPAAPPVPPPSPKVTKSAEKTKPPLKRENTPLSLQELASKSDEMSRRRNSLSYESETGETVQLTEEERLVIQENLTELKKDVKKKQITKDSFWNRSFKTFQKRKPENAIIQKEVFTVAVVPPKEGEVITSFEIEKVKQETKQRIIRETVRDWLNKDNKSDPAHKVSTKKKKEQISILEGFLYGSWAKFQKKKSENPK